MEHQAWIPTEKPRELTKQQLSKINTTNLVTLRLAHFDLPDNRPGDVEGLQEAHGSPFDQLPHQLYPSGHLQEWFASLEALDLSHNKIKQLNAKTFAGLSSLRRLDLDFNEISSLGSEFFTGLPKLEELSLRGNRIRDFEWSVLEELPSLTTLNLARNQLTRINRNSFNQLKELDT